MAIAHVSKATPATPKKEAVFFANLRAGNTVAFSAAAAGLVRQTLYKRRDRDKAFARQWDTAEDAGTDVLEQEAFRRAVQGTNHPVTYRGTITATYKEYSDVLLIFLLKARRPEKYREHMELSGPRGEPVPVTIVHHYEGVK